MAVLIEARDLRKRFGAINAVDGISLEVVKGEVLGFLGPNGAGKSTTMKMLTGFLEPDSGSAYIGGISVSDQPIAAKTKLGYMPEGAPAYGDMNTRSFLRFIAEIRGFEGAEAERRVQAAVEKAALESVLEQKIDTLSKGYKRRVGMAQAILHDPQVLIMDEPTDGLDPNQKHHARKLITDMAKDKAIIVSTHILEEVEAVCSRAVIINKGKIVADGTAEILDAPPVLSRHHRHACAIEPGRGREEGVAGVLRHSKRRNGRCQQRQGPPAGGTARRRTRRTQLASLIRTRLIEVEEVVVQRGSLDEVFREITTSDDGAHHG